MVGWLDFGVDTQPPNHPTTQLSNMSDEFKSATCYLLLGGADGALDVTLRSEEGKIAELNIQSKSGFGGMVWELLAKMLVGAPLEKTALNQRITQMTATGLLPNELNLHPLVNALVNLGKQ
ncbi:MAG: hypothetical protein KGJ80_17035 [Chloroflexota bacterium]|nr:hypothetical protein [Chloroflexota bacterium]